MRHWILFFSSGGEGEQDFRKGLQVAATVNRFSELRHAEFLVPVDSAEPQHEARPAGEAADDVVGRAQRDVRVVCIGLLGQQLLGVFVSFLQPLQALEMLFLQHHVGVRFHSRGQRQCKKGFRVFSIFRQPLFGEFSRTRDRFLEAFYPRGIWLAVNSVQKSFLVEEEIAREHALAEKLLEEITGRNGNLAKRLVGMLQFPIVKFFPRFREVLGVERMKSSREFRDGSKGGTVLFFVCACRAGGRHEEHKTGRTVDSPMHSNSFVQKSPGRKRGLPVIAAR